MGVGGVLVALHAQVNGCPYPRRVQRLDLFAEQVQFGGQQRMALRPVGPVLRVSVMALGEDLTLST